LDAGRGIYITEFGYCTNDPSPYSECELPQVSSSDQPAYLNQTDHFMYHNKVVKTVAQYVLVDGAGAPGNIDQWATGIYSSDGTPKPARDAYRLGLDVTSDGQGGMQVFVLDRSGGTPLVFGYLTLTNVWVPVATPAVDTLGYGEATVAAATASQVSAWRAYDGQYTSRCISGGACPAWTLPVMTDSQCVAQSQ
jgi:hypothetical protein